ncbi:copper resistance CopC family protein [Nocardioides sp. C4-1]|uniref:copper resistance CopC family protein n=1 Tax=Nocardioides sp. C4-1 TaxID=3151851 RepID=UPI00326681A0
MPDVSAVVRSARRIPAVVCSMVLALLFLWPTPAEAHDALVLSDPAEAGVVTSLPSRMTLTFSGPISEVLTLELEGPDGSVTNGTPTVDEAEVRQNLWTGPDGDYVLTYEVLSEDGHEVGGEVTFAQGPVAVAGETPSAPTGSAAERLSGPAVDSGGSSSGLGGVVVPVLLVAVAAGLSLVVVVRKRRGVEG